MPSRLLVVRVPVDEVELASDELWARGATAIEERAGRPGTVELVVELDAVGDPGGLGWPVEVVVVDDSWWDGWRAWATPVRAGTRLVVQPPWIEPAPVHRGDVVIEIDPGRSFGSGAHPSTRLALGALEELVTPGAALLDVGSGSGVLAIAARRLGAGRVLAIDVDPEARAATGENAVRNGVVVEVASLDLDDVTGRFDIVVANLLAPVLEQLATSIRERLAPGGALVVSGLLPQHSERVFGRLRPLVVARRYELDGWVAATLTLSG